METMQPFYSAIPASVAGRKRFGTVRWIACLLLFAVGAPTVSALDLDVGLVEEEAILPIGESLSISWTEAPPDALLELSLTDEDDTLIAHRLITSDESGALKSVSLWRRTGVVGCDPCSSPDPATYRYETFSEAEIWLADRKLTLSIFDAQDTLLRKVTVRTKPIPTERFFFADATGCPRSFLTTGENLYLMGENVRSRPWPIRFFLVDAPEPLAGETINEVRTSFSNSPQEVFPANTNGYFLELLAPANQVDRRILSGVVRADSDDDTYIRRSDDIIPMAVGQLSANYALNGVKEDSLADDDIGPCEE